MWVFSGMPQQYLNKELGYELDSWKKMWVQFRLGKNTFALAFFLLLKFVWGPFSYNLFAKYATNEEDQQNQKLSFFTSFLKIQSHFYIIWWFILRKVYY